MIFDFGRCIYEPENWRYDSYYENCNKVTEEEYKLHHTEITNYKSLQNEDDLKFATCDQYAVLTLYFRTTKIYINFYDDEINKVCIALHEAVSSGSYYVKISNDNFCGHEEDLDTGCHVYGGINTYAC